MVATRRRVARERMAFRRNVEWKVLISGTRRPIRAGGSTDLERRPRAPRPRRSACRAFVVRFFGRAKRRSERRRGRSVPVPRAVGRCHRYAGSRRERAVVDPRRTDSSRPLTAAQCGGTGVFRISANRRRRRWRAARNAGSPGASATRSPLSRLSTARGGHRSDQLQRGDGTLRVPGRFGLSRRRQHQGQVRATRSLHGVSPERRSHILAWNVERDQCEPGDHGHASQRQGPF